MSMEPSAYLEGWRERARRDAEAFARACDHARAAVPKVASLLARQGARRVWLIGSLPRGTFRPGSDLDFMVEGLDEETAWRAASRAAGEVGLAVDVVRAESLPSGWRDYHMKHGEFVHG